MKKVLAVLFLAPVLLVSTAQAAAISVALDALKFVVTNQTTIATTFAVAHTATGTGAPGSGLGFQFSVTGAGIHSNSSDFFPHPPPPTIVGSDSAIASAFADSWYLGFGGTANAHATASKGDFAAAGAYARGGARASAIAGSLAATGLTSASASFNLGGLTISGSKDPSNSFYGFMVSDQNPTAINQRLLSQAILGTSLGEPVSDELPPELSIGMPDHIFYALFLSVDGSTGQLQVQNFGTSVTTALTASDFEDISTATDSIYRLRGTGDFTIEIPFEDLSASGQNISFDEISLEVAAVPEPSTLLLLMIGLIGAGFVSARAGQARKG